MSETLPISVIMSVYKEPTEWLCQSIDSILNQTFPDFEFIIICDNPEYNDGIKKLKDYAVKDCRINLIFNEENIGLTKSLNKGLKVSKGKYVARMDADDISLPTRLEKQYEYMENHPDVIVLGTMLKRFGHETCKTWWEPNEAANYSDDDLKAQMLFGNCIAHPTAMIRKDVLSLNHITYDESYRHSQDYRLWEQLMPFGKFAKLKDVLLNYRVSEQQITKSNSLSQSNLSFTISYRCQYYWLESMGFAFNIEEIQNEPFKILDEIKTRKSLRNSKSFKAFVQFVYLNSQDGKKRLASFVKGDFRYMTIWNSIRYILKNIKR